VNQAQRIAVGIVSGLAAGAVAYGAWWLVVQTPEPKAAEKPAPAAAVAKVVKEDDLNTIVLTEAAIQRLGLKTAAVETKASRRVRVYGGEVAVPAGRTIPVTSPIGGVLKAPEKGVPRGGHEGGERSSGSATVADPHAGRTGQPRRGTRGCRGASQ
jgi:hypothetical protein